MLNRPRRAFAFVHGRMLSARFRGNGRDREILSLRWNKKNPTREKGYVCVAHTTACLCPAYGVRAGENDAHRARSTFTVNERFVILVNGN